jgi:glycosyltransferase involved in cell wall biosynthesis
MKAEVECDVCILAEGTYPYVAGGVSSVISQMIHAMPDLRFTVFYIGSTPALAEDKVYPVPEQVRRIEEVFLFDQLEAAEANRSGKPSPAREALVAELKNFFLTAEEGSSQDEVLFRVIDQYVEAAETTSFEDLIQDPQAWELLLEYCRRKLPEDSFIDFFYATRFMALPLWALMRGLARLPRARVYHSLCTGYAGLAALVGARRYGARSVVSEHGIYVKERITELSLATWIHEADNLYVTVDSDLGALKKIWIKHFHYLAECVYRSCDRLTTLYRGNQSIQEAFGAPRDKIEIIPNGIDIEVFRPAYERRRERLKSDPVQVIGFVGRVVRIKDIRTLLRAMQIIHKSLPNLALKIFGPMDEEPEYAQDCVEFATQLGIEDAVTFAGKQDLREVLGEVDVMVLTSISEGQPLVVLEGFACGIPCVSTDVGSCRSLIMGDSQEDRAIGPAGTLTRVASPRQIAVAVQELIKDKERLMQLGENGRQRVECFYNQRSILASYRSLYKELMDLSTEEGGLG